MSDGMRDCRIIGERASAVEEAAEKLVEAIEESMHRGWAVDVLAHANPILKRVGYHLLRVRP